MMEIEELVVASSKIVEKPDVIVVFGLDPNPPPPIWGIPLDLKMGGLTEIFSTFAMFKCDHVHCIIITCHNLDTWNIVSTKLYKSMY